MLSCGPGAPVSPRRCHSPSQSPAPSTIDPALPPAREEPSSTPPQGNFPLARVQAHLNVTRERMKHQFHQQNTNIDQIYHRHPTTQVLHEYNSTWQARSSSRIRYKIMSDIYGITRKIIYQSITKFKIIDRGGTHKFHKLWSNQDMSDIKHWI